MDVVGVDIAVIGHFAKDKIIVRGEEQISSGGSVYYGAIVLRRMGLNVAVITRLKQDDFGLLDELKDEGILVFAQPAAETSGIENTYFTADMDRRLCKPLGFAGPFRLEDLPDIQTKVFLVGPIMAGEVDIPLLRALSSTGPVALDAQGFVRVPEGADLVLRDWPQKREGLALVDVLKVDTAEAEVLTGQTDMRQAIRELAAYGPREIVLTRPQGVLVYADGEFYQAPFNPREVRGRTGRGDTCFAAYLGRRLTADPEEACRFAAAVTSFKLEQPGPFRGTIEDIERQLALTQHASHVTKKESPMPRIKITAGDVIAFAELNETATARAIWRALPIEAKANTWGDEIYFSIPVYLEEENAQEIVEKGDLGYWPVGHAFCIFFGRTPASRGDEIRPASPVNVFGRVEGDPTVFRKVRDGEKVMLERVEAGGG